jgi:hypothetical protein
VDLPLAGTTTGDTAAKHKGVTEFFFRDQGDSQLLAVASRASAQVGRNSEARNGKIRNRVNRFDRVGQIRGRRAVEIHPGDI